MNNLETDLKLLNENGEFVSAKEGAAMLDIAEREDFNFIENDYFDIVEYNRNSEITLAVFLFPHIPEHRTA